MKILFKVAIKHPFQFVKGVVGGFRAVIKRYRDPNYVPMSKEVADHAWKTNIEKLKKFT